MANFYLLSVSCLILINHQLASGMLIYDDMPEMLVCPEPEAGAALANDIADNCHLLKLYNQTLVEEMKLENRTRFELMLQECSCALISLRHLWEDYYDNNLWRSLSLIVDQTIQQHMNPDEQAAPTTASATPNNIDNYPKFLWSDIDVTFYGVSIYTATKDYFDKFLLPDYRMSSSLFKILRGDQTWKLITQLCLQISRDKYKLYRYMENLNRLSPVAFSRAILKYDTMDITYQASKACKLPLLPKLHGYKLRPANSRLVPASDNPAREFGLLNLDNNEDSSQQAKLNHYAQDLENAHQPEELLEPSSRDLDTMLTDASAYLLNCAHWQTSKNSIRELERECPMMMVDSPKKIPLDWLTNHTSALSRSQTAVKCACQLLLHNSTWALIMRDRNVQTMATALTNYMNENRIPDFSSAPIMSIFGWFQNVMQRFENRKASIKEIMKVKYRDQDPTVVMKHDTQDESLELLRRGCNYIMFNYNKGSPEAVSELKLIRYLDNLQTISQDPMFVFHLSLQDPNLFKLNALSKMCKPIVT